MRAHGGKNLRRNSAALIDDDILLDMTASCFQVAASTGRSLGRVRWLLATHPHEDHLYLDALKYYRGSVLDLDTLPSDQRAVFFAAGIPAATPLHIFGGPFVETLLETIPGLLTPGDRRGVTFSRIQAGTRYEQDTFAFTPILAHHGEQGYTHNYIVERGGKTLLYALDTGGYDPQMLDILYAHRYDAVICECSYGLKSTCEAGHMTLAKCEAFLVALTERGCWTGAPRFYLSHMGPHWTPPHDLMEPIAAQAGMLLAYDGLTVSV